MNSDHFGSSKGTAENLAEVSVASREAKATEYIRQSGKAIHSSDCATSCAPAYEPGPCDCNEPQPILAT